MNGTALLSHCDWNIKFILLPFGSLIIVIVFKCSSNFFVGSFLWVVTGIRGVIWNISSTLMKKTKFLMFGSMSFETLFITIISLPTHVTLREPEFRRTVRTSTPSTLPALFRHFLSVVAFASFKLDRVAILSSQIL